MMAEALCIKLLADQIGPFRQGVAAIERYGGVLLALRIGTGKTYVGLALGGHFAAGEPIDVIGPGILRNHWHRTAAEVEVCTILRVLRKRQACRTLSVPCTLVDTKFDGAA